MNMNEWMDESGKKCPFGPLPLHILPHDHDDFYTSTTNWPPPLHTFFYRLVRMNVVLLAISENFSENRACIFICFGYVACSGAGSISKVGGTNFGAKRRTIFLLSSPNFFMVPPMTGHYRKVQGTVTRTELWQSWPTVRGQSDLWLFSHAVSKVTSPVDRSWSLGGFL